MLEPTYVYEYNSAYLVAIYKTPSDVSNSNEYFVNSSWPTFKNVWLSD